MGEDGLRMLRLFRDNAEHRRDCRALPEGEPCSCGMAELMLAADIYLATPAAPPSTAGGDDWQRDVDFEAVMHLDNAFQSVAPERSSLLGQRRYLLHALSAERARAGAAEAERGALLREAEMTLAFYRERGRVTVELDGNAVQRMGASAEIAIQKAEQGER